MFGRRIGRGLLVLGVVLGFGSGFAHMARHGAHFRADHFQSRKAELMNEFARSCVDAARHAAPPAAPTAPASTAPAAPTVAHL
jgi:hypothetical protein